MKNGCSEHRHDRIADVTVFLESSALSASEATRWPHPGQKRPGGGTAVPHRGHAGMSRVYGGTASLFQATSSAHGVVRSFASG